MAASGGNAFYKSFPNVPRGNILPVIPKKTLISTLNRYRKVLSDSEFKGVFSALLHKIIAKYKFQTWPKPPRLFISKIAALKASVTSTDSDNLVLLLLHYIDNGIRSGELFFSAATSADDTFIGMVDSITPLEIRAYALKVRRRKTRRRRTLKDMKL